jgi:hypothetical protein
LYLVIHLLKLIETANFISVKCYIKEKSWMARIAALKLRQDKMAMVIGSTILLHNTTEAELINNKPWLRHELAHVRQFKQYGTFRFLVLYLLESIKHGYHNNKFEREARASENDETLDKHLILHCS